MTLQIETIVLGSLGTNAYLLKNTETNHAVVIDPGMKPGALLRRIEPLQVEAILLTHAHFDHMAGVDEVRDAKGCPVYLHDLEADWMTDPKKNGSARWPEVGGAITARPAEYDLAEGQVLKLLGTEIRVLHTPGHSPGSVSFLWEDRLFGGDALFRLGVGRTDLYGGNERELHDTLHNKLFKLDDAVQVYPGHGPKTTIGYERANNPYA
ncbi:MBL fold metallo-hydrolase [Gorillibacterium timonense]|uniref:MBL fold metallo-hydrolase n=1 Tax=Gorillibacterium timonense TaxID=1689269 RepID=UPI00071C9DF8|nr:MBL fold metallo-hydrolase [Gorillibacterium timonense]